MQITIQTLLTAKEDLVLTEKYVLGRLSDSRMYTTLVNPKQVTMSASTLAGADAVRLIKGTLTNARKPPIALNACLKSFPLFNGHLHTYISTNYQHNIPLCDTMGLINSNQY